MATKSCIDCSKLFDDRGADYAVRCFPCYIEHKKAQTNPFNRSKTLPPLLPEAWFEFLEEIPALLQACHPDKHNQSKGSIRLTHWLLAVKKKHSKDKKTG